MPRVKGESRNRELARGINAIPKGRMFAKAGRWVHASKKHEPKKTEEKVIRSRFYPADDEPKPLNRNFTPGTAKLRSSITPGTVLIVLAGRFRGRRVVFLKQLESGLLLVTGPFKLNGCPLRRINQAYVIATSTKLDVSGVTVPENVNDSFFKAHKNGKTVKSEEKFFSDQTPKKPEIAQERKALQAKVDEAILSKVDDVTKSYLAAVFTLRKNDYPHEMNF